MSSKTSQKQYTYTYIYSHLPHFSQKSRKEEAAAVLKVGITVAEGPALPFVIVYCKFTAHLISRASPVVTCS